MKKPRTISLLAAMGLTAACGIGIASAQTFTNLLHDPFVRANGTYTYYARSGDPFSVLFYPGPPHGATTNYRDGTLNDSINPPAPVSIGSGELTGTSSLGLVAGWQGVVSADGKFDLLFDLGGQFLINRVDIVYQDFASYRWDKSANAQVIRTASVLSGSAPAESDFSAWASATATTQNTSSANLTMTFMGPEVQAQYLDLLLDVEASGGSNYGGVIRQVNVYGTAIPEPRVAILAFVAGLVFCLLRTRKSPSR